MEPIIIDGEELPENIIILHEVRHKYIIGNCKHTQFEIDRELAQIKCLKCEKLLNPIELLARFASEQNLWWHRAKEYKENLIKLKEADAVLEKKHRCKCEHCGKMTKIYRHYLSVVK